MNSHTDHSQNIRKSYQTFKEQQIPILSNDYRQQKGEFTNAHISDIRFCLTNTTKTIAFFNSQDSVGWLGLVGFFISPYGGCHLGLQSIWKFQEAGTSKRAHSPG